MRGKYLIAVLMVIFLIGCKGQIDAEHIEIEQGNQEQKQATEQKTAKEVLTEKKAEQEQEKQTEQQSEIPEFCKPGEKLTGVECECKEGYRYCAEQKRCIKENSCCSLHNCGSFEYCVLTQYRITFCIQTETQKMCKSVTEQDTEEVFDDIEGIRIKVKEFLAGKTILEIDGEEIELMPTIQEEYNGMLIWTEETQILGGYCREDVD